MTTGPARYWLASCAGLAVMGLCTGGVLLAQPEGAVPGAATLQSQLDAPLTPPVVTRPESEAVSIYRDGEFAATGNYLTPGGDESIGVTLVLAGGVVTAADVETEALSPTARQFQLQFGAEISVSVVGRDLASLTVSRVAGASLTSVGFNDALVRIQAAAERS